MENKFDRSISLIGIDNFNKLSSLTFLIVGLGGVGGSCLEGLVRSGAKNFILVDNDSINITNLNRQIVSNIFNVTKSKVLEAEKFIKSINNECDIKTYDYFLDSTNIDEIFENKIDIVIDCIDSSTSKIVLYKKCLEKNIPIISSMGTANKLDPSFLAITTLSKTDTDPLAKKLRLLCKENNIDSKQIIVCYSKETPITNLHNPLPSMMMVPNCAGMFIVSYIIRNLLK